jgi:predicted DNA-binding antitoxin AbrB/MazE fold protein
MRSVPNTINARFHGGVFQPLTAVNLREDAMVKITVEEQFVACDPGVSFARAAGAWKGLVDEDVIKEIYADRGIDNREEVKL